MNILVLTNLYPPHHAGTYNFRCKAVVRGLQDRGHDVWVLTSNHGLTSEELDPKIQRRLRLNGVYGHPSVTEFGPLRELETDNHASLHDCVERFRPQMIYVWSLHGLSKSLIFGLHRLQLPIVFDVDDYWITNDLRSDPWLSWWNKPKLSMAANMLRSSLELSGQRKKIDETAPTRDSENIKRLSHIYDADEHRTEIQPNTITTFRFNRIRFVSNSLRDSAIQVGYRMDHPEVIHPGVPVARFKAPIRTPGTGPIRLLVTSPLHKESGVMQVLKALKILRDSNQSVQLTITGRGDSEYNATLRSFVLRYEVPVEFVPVADAFKDMPAVYRQHDILVHPPEWAEPCAINQLEAMAAGMAVVSSGAGGSIDTLQDGENALLFTPGNAEELAAQIGVLINDPDMRTAISTNGQRTVSQYYDESVVLDRIEAFLKASV